MLVFWTRVDGLGYDVFDSIDHCRRLAVLVLASQSLGSTDPMLEASTIDNVGGSV